jgi:hypothetical protein
MISQGELGQSKTIGTVGNEIEVTQLNLLDIKKN